jgi:hypothetical protein
MVIDWVWAVWGQLEGVGSSGGAGPEVRVVLLKRRISVESVKIEDVVMFGFLESNR